MFVRKCFKNTAFTFNKELQVPCQSCFSC